MVVRQPWSPVCVEEKGSVFNISCESEKWNVRKLENEKETLNGRNREKSKWDSDDTKGRIGLRSRGFRYEQLKTNSFKPPPIWHRGGGHLPSSALLLSLLPFPSSFSFPLCPPSILPLPPTLSGKGWWQTWRGGDAFGHRNNQSRVTRTIPPVATAHAHTHTSTQTHTRVHKETYSNVCTDTEIKYAPETQKGPGECV